MADIYNKITALYGHYDNKRPKCNGNNSTTMRRHSFSTVIIKPENCYSKSKAHRSNDFCKPRNSYSSLDSNIGPNLAPFKSSILKNVVIERALMGIPCQKCHPRMRIDSEVPPLSSLGLSNILRVPTQNRNNNIISRTFHYAKFIMSRKTDGHFPDVCKKVIRCERVQKAIKEAAIDDFEEMREDEAGTVDHNELKTLMGKQRLRAVSILHHMKSCISHSLLRIASWILYKLLSRMITAILFHKGQIEMLRRTRMSTATTPVIYLPLHRSHLDYILVSFVLFMNNIKPPLVAAGDNLLIPFFGTLMRGLGAFFIKRRLDHKSGKKDRLYRAVLHSYMTENLREGYSMEFFIEGGRSRSGKALMPKAGLLSVIVDAVHDGVIDDAFIVPVAISYEKLIDGSFVGEQLGKPKVMESFSTAARAIWSTLHSNFGSVRVDFCQPFSLKEYFNRRAIEMHKNVPNNFPNETDDIRSNDPCVACSGLRSVSSSSSLYGLDIVVSEDKRQSIEDLAEHIVYDAFNSTALMSTHLLSFLLLTRHRKGATLQQLTQSMNWLREECIRRRRDVGFSGDSSDAIKNACQLLGKDLVSIEKMSMAWTSPLTSSGDAIGENNVNIVFLKPAVKLPHVFELQYYANTCISVFQNDSAVVNALYSLINAELETLSYSGDDGKSEITIFYDDLMNRSVELCNILQYDFLFSPPCTSLSDIIADTIDNLIYYGILVDDNTTTAESERFRKMYSHLGFHDEDDDDGYCGSNYRRTLRVVITEETVSHMQFLRSVLSPYIESYWLGSCALIQLIHTEKEDKIFLNYILKTAKERQNQGLLSYDESVAAEPLRNAMKLFESWKVIQTNLYDSVRIVSLNKEFDNDYAINDIISKVEKFKI